ncbi:TatD family hydrolase [Isoptericola chiayiensis]|uniref:TatD family hydrolase n=1 Tax=Isoptericola chiayiensis TaxID=579446 RepID=A0ABP8Y490_9MICO|nr:TatD family hydrolase [Isoptericola chiayiensis]NOV99473.1 TatD DNase family protein [Isoptericola chiayiensis]
MGRSKRERGFPPDPEPLPVPVVDNHTHLDVIDAVLDERALQGAPVPTVADHLERAAAVGVDRLVQVGCELPTIAWTDALLRDPAYGSSLLGAVAIHPNEAVLHAGVREVGPDGLEPDPQPHHATSLDDAVARVAAVARDNPRIRAIGETGMDLFRTGPRGEAAQRESFRAHVALAKELGLALQIHDRDAHEQVIDVLLGDGAPERTIFHCYSGDEQMAALAAEHGWYLSFAGPVTYPKNDHLRAALRTIPLDHVLVETDAPFLPPHPYRGRPIGPYVVGHTVRAMAEILDRPLEEVCDTVSATSVEVYGAW